ncbi:hypothetical protein BpHYR1_049145 [Brachionus plicatilis]|uniref:Uncharacterized protein n=1 Tax=Brachionus plicatilis TaxID=10195 RepID=A0A3M7SL57_BRAPC|nr:hypothetical protein BpHYR1_049145 [Brachionus plicatilis]
MNRNEPNFEINAKIWAIISLSILQYCIIIIQSFVSANKIKISTKDEHLNLVNLQIASCKFLKQTTNMVAQLKGYSRNLKNKPLSI